MSDPRLEEDSPPTGEPASRRELGHRLLVWFFKNKRNLPWREEHDPYRIWISEVMLQQTRSQTAVLYYRRWLEIFPDIETLARSSEQEVLKVWEGLGYYGRARNLLQAAGMIVEQRGGRFPDTPSEIRRLPGVGEYTAAAVLSIAFAEPHAVADGNVVRVVSRLTTEAATGSTALRNRAKAFVESTFSGFHPGWINQAWMELGALVCLPVPRCSACPLAYTCTALRENRVEEFPVKAPLRSLRSLPLREESLLVLVPLSMRSRLEKHSILSREINGAPQRLGKLLLSLDCPVLLLRRASGGLLGGLWELPNFPERGEELTERLTGLSIQILLDTGREVRHRYSHFEIRFHCHLGMLRDKKPLQFGVSQPWVESRWVALPELAGYPRPKVHIEAMKLFGMSAS